jgi:uncharacterized membrane protein YbjE (DUF340 family)
MTMAESTQLITLLFTYNILLKTNQISRKQILLEKKLMASQTSSVLVNNFTIVP